MKSARRKHPRVRACPNCGSTDLDSSYGPADPVMAGTNLGMLTCSQCGHAVVPITFSNENQRQRFAQARSKLTARGRFQSAYPMPGVALARLDAGVSIVFSILIGVSMYFVGQPLAGGLLAAGGILAALFFLRR